LDAFRRYREELARWSERTNLTALHRPEQVVRDGFLDSLACLPFLPSGPVGAIDIGSGAGFPAIPLALLRRDMTFTLIEASRKKSSFLRHAARLLDLPLVRVIWGRAELAARESEHIGVYAVATARAAAHPAQQAAMAAPFLQAGGRFLAQVGPSCPTAELLERLPGEVYDLDTETPLADFLGGPRRRLIALRRR
jgi:16S rRNA (guanine527-N7)-methyltransferase